MFCHLNPRNPGKENNKQKCKEKLHHLFPFANRATSIPLETQFFIIMHNRETNETNTIRTTQLITVKLLCWNRDNINIIILKVDKQINAFIQASSEKKCQVTIDTIKLKRAKKQSSAPWSSYNNNNNNMYVSVCLIPLPNIFFFIKFKWQILKITQQDV